MYHDRMARIALIQRVLEARSDALGLKSCLKWSVRICIAAVAITALAACFSATASGSPTVVRPAVASTRDVRITDVRDSSFVVSWVSESAEVGSVQWGASSGGLSNTSTDVRGATVSSTVHFVRITGLVSATAYSFDVVTGRSTDDLGGAHFKATTGVPQNPGQPDSIYGTVVDQAGVPVRDVLVYLTVRNSNGSSSGQMATIITPNDKGYWISSLDNTRASNGQGVFFVSPDSQLEIVVEGGALGSASATTTVASARAGAPVVALPGRMSQAPSASSTPMTVYPTATQVPLLPTATLTVVPSPSLTVSPSAGAQSPTATQVPLDPNATLTVVPTPSMTVGPSAGAQTPGQTGGAGPTGSSTNQGPVAGSITAATLPALAPLLVPDLPLPVGSSPELPTTPAPVDTGPSGAGSIGIADLPAAPMSADVPKNVPRFLPIAGAGGAVLISADAWLELEGIGTARATITLDNAPPVENDVQAGSLGGGIVVPVGRPIDLRLDLLDPKSSRIVAPRTSTVKISISLPVTAAATGGVFAWLVAEYDDYGFAGYIRPVADFNPESNTVTVQIPVQGMTGTLFLPTIIVPATVLSLDPDAHLYSAAGADGEDFGPIGPQFTALTVVAPQLRQRLYVFNPRTENYGWVDVNAVGPG